jgi:hypothetical protein
LDKEISSASTKELEKLTTQRRELEQQLTYVMYYPRDMKYIGLFVGELDERNLNLMAKAKIAAFKARKEDVDAGLPDKVQSCLGRDVSIDDDGNDDEDDDDMTELKTTARNCGRAILKKQLFNKSATVEEVNASVNTTSNKQKLSDAFFTEELEGLDSDLHKSKRGRPTESVQDRKRYAAGSKQGDRLRSWQTQHKSKSTFIAVPRANPRSYEPQSYTKSAPREDQPRRNLAPRGGRSERPNPTQRDVQGGRYGGTHRVMSDWEAGGGLSAAAAGERNRQKQIGLIVHGQGTKRTFDE